MSYYDDHEDELLALLDWVDEHPDRLSDAAHAELVEKGIWRSADGRETPITEMGDQHLVNALRYVVRFVLHDFETHLARMRADEVAPSSYQFAAKTLAWLLAGGPNVTVASTTSGRALLEEWKRRGYHVDGWHINFRARLKKKSLYQDNPEFMAVVWHHDPAASGPRERAFLTYGPKRSAVLYARATGDHAEWWVEFAGRDTVERGAAPDLSAAKLTAFRMWEGRR